MSRTEEEQNNMEGVLYAYAIGSLMYAMVGLRHDIAHVVGVVSRLNTRRQCDVGYFIRCI